jgi:hypothetical protein
MKRNKSYCRKKNILQVNETTVFVTVREVEVLGIASSD